MGVGCVCVCVHLVVDVCRGFEVRPAGRGMRGRGGAGVGVELGDEGGWGRGGRGGGA